MNDLDMQTRSLQLLLLNGRTAYHFMFVDCCFNVDSIRQTNNKYAMSNKYVNFLSVAACRAISSTDLLVLESCGRT